MDLIKINRKMNKVLFSALSYAGKFKYLVDYQNAQHYLRKNNELKNVHKDETCYIVGNGPSVAKMDLSCLSSKLVITVNKSLSSPVYDILKPKYHMVCDRIVLSKISDDIKKELSQNRYETKFILHRSVYKTIGESKNVYYVYANQLPIGTNIKFDLTKNCDAFMNVLPFAIMNAIYMGFKKIVLLGCDFSFFASRKDQHFYNIGVTLNREESLYQDLVGSSIAIMQFESLYGYCQKNDIKLINCTPNSLLDVIPQDRLENWLDE